MKVRMVMSRELLEQMLMLGDRRIVDVEFRWTEYPIEPTAQLVLTIDAPDAPEGTTEMEPVYQRADDGTATMADPGWTIR